MTEVDGTRWDNLALCIVQRTPGSQMMVRFSALLLLLASCSAISSSNNQFDNHSVKFTLLFDIISSICCSPYKSNQTPVKPIFDTILATVTTQSKSVVPPHELSRMSLISFTNPTGPLFKGIERSYLNDSD
ncbi:unnamed protein product [Brugia pahangi]|uniref:Secreted protein n=1 Tax=Brugia pahangi TaxID=6280 RepID=A0A0N4SY21_BRUPA|nr:unnamed protein product [Brugia pahangi]